MINPKNLAIPAILTLLTILTQLFSGFSEQYLIYQREAILSGQWWRLLSGHIYHLGWTHLAMNLAGVIVIWGLAGKLLTNREWLLGLLICSLATGLGLLLFSPNLDWYVGLSGVLHGLMMIVAIRLISHQESIGWLILVVIIAKVLWEQWAGPSTSLESQIGGNVVVDAHLYGALSGVITGWILQTNPLRYFKKGG